MRILSSWDVRPGEGSRICRSGLRAVPSWSLFRSRGGKLAEHLCSVRCRQAFCGVGRFISRLVLALRGKHVRSERINCLHPMSNELEIRPGVHLNSRLCLPRGL